MNRLLLFAALGNGAAFIVTRSPLYAFATVCFLIAAVMFARRGSR